MRRVFAMLLALAGPLPAAAQEVPIKALGRFDGWRENALVGYGLVIGLSGSGDTRQSVVTRQALRNALGRLGTNVESAEISSRNVAVVMVTATLPPSANVGDRIDATIASIGDARSLAGGTLIMTPMLGPDGRTYALAQGQLLVGGHRFDSQLNREQRNYPTSAILQGGATIEASVDSSILKPGGELSFLLAEPSFSTAERIAAGISGRLGPGAAWARNADEVRVRYAGPAANLTAFLADIERVTVRPDAPPRVVINERTGTVVAGGDVTLSSVVIAQGDIKISVVAENVASQPDFYTGFASDPGGVRSLIVTNTRLNVAQGAGDRTFRFPSTTIADLVQALSNARVDTQRMIGILQAIKAAGALHADLVIR
ncbi:flagellar biosynthesis protein FlgA [Sphingomonas sp. Leaf407]|uniref:flagellar basal body P-ring protein FlgI n=1 Tax=unclassified Sphingomonas TaxID=196159 RepID=UPI0006F81E4E|nr:MULTISPECIES: flagellar basal body P-ring protein FlgI [unclassified Sphingomonas]KQN39491.1 flagellar biosynthesis protein FlgA [Sphingomonas sp. Leaf42]KQT28768.1 flagellar biosynthesis protein FlgA [Sphingomonas sp. Leaf407]